MHNTRVHARVVHTVQRALADAIDGGKIEADLLLHFGGELNPSWDYGRGVRDVVRPDLRVDPDEEREGSRNGYVQLDESAIREALCAGQPVFGVGWDPLVARQPAIATERAPRAPILDELERWIAAHPGPQRATLEALEGEWLERLRALDADTRQQVARLVAKKLNSPKLAEMRERVVKLVLA
jgi:hypothetical protein